MGVKGDKEERWILEIQKGDKEAFERLFTTYYFDLTRFVWRYVKSNAIAEELVQEVFANIWQDRAQWHPTSSLKLYLYQSVKNQALDYLRHQEVRKKYDPKWMAAKDNPTLDYRDPRRKKQVQEAIRREIEALPPRSKMTYKLHRYDGLTYSEIAEVMDVSVKTVESQMTRTLKRLRKRLSHLLPFLVVAFFSV
ncbi:RNA polymerase sigma-70 factor [Fodinibius sediminis]|uniref:RNA polymerase sigma-70 factor, ECF subfamily n=1 Tax=Fodinibius sediminis TaxID=1214077 RepID=A0A521CTN3_9BACT|nr:RNA polymerase sigma-70 factor [Fodinibius sediminis]SMO62765.1 RNA polymerase sigma-70 factor, ECF subfamily [Fodinibius sediminis]